MYKKLSFRLNENDIDKAIRELAQYRRELKARVAALIAALTDAGAEIARAEVRGLGAFYTGELEGSIVGYFSPSTNVGIIRAGAPHAVYVEFGTGITGKGSPHPAPKDWVYDVNSHGEKGWWYMSDYDGKLHWTQGLPSRPFMYNTCLQLERECQKIAKEVFSK